MTLWAPGQGRQGYTMCAFVSETEHSKDLGRKFKVIQEA